jgi:hypothetical protein
MVSVMQAECQKLSPCAECHYDECHYAECHVAGQVGNFSLFWVLTNRNSFSKFKGLKTVDILLWHSE